MTLAFLIFIVLDFALWGAVACVAGYLAGNQRGYEMGYRTGLTGRAAAYRRDGEVTAVVRR
jgi:hypothetical protein